MSNFTRIVRRHPENPDNLNAPGATKFRRTGVTAYAGTGKDTGLYHNGDGVMCSLPYRCAVRRRPYRGNSERMRGAA